MPVAFPDSSVGKESAYNEKILGDTYIRLPGGSAGKESTCNVGDLGSTPRLGKSPGGGKSYPLQYSGLENSMDCIVHGVAKSQRQLSDFHSSFYKHFLGTTNA